MVPSDDSTASSRAPTASISRGVSWGLGCLDIEVVRRLIEHEKVCPAEHHHRECYSSPLPAGKSFGAALGLISREAEASKMTLHLPAFPVWPELADDIEESLVHGHLRHILPVI